MNKTELMKEYNGLVKEAPKGYFDWIRDKNVNYFLFFRVKGRKMTCKCSKCGKEYTVFIRSGDTLEQQTFERVIPKPDNHGYIKCLECGTTVECINRGKNDKRDWYTTYLCQRIKDGIVIRKFHTTSRTQIGGETQIKNWEGERLFLIKGRPSLRISKLYSNGNSWTIYNHTSFDVHPTYGAEQINKSHLKYNSYDLFRGINMVTEEKGIKYISACDYLYAYNNMPQIESFLKIGLKSLVEYIVRNKGICGYINLKEKGFEKIFRIKNQRFELLKKHNGDTRFLQILQYEKRNGLNLNLKDIEKIYYILNHISFMDLREMFRYMSPIQLINRVEKYAKKEINVRGLGDPGLLIKYRDYLQMRKELGYDMTNSVFLYPRSLEKAHKEMVKEKAKRQDELYINKMEKEFPLIREKYKNLCKKYELHEDGIFIRPARSAGEIVMEGRILHHCVGREWYISGHNKGTSYILMLRKEEEPETPFITVEFEKKGIVQWYGAHDHKPKDPKYKEWLERFEKKVLHKKERKAS